MPTSNNTTITPMPLRRTMTLADEPVDRPALDAADTALTANALHVAPLSLQRAPSAMPLSLQRAPSAMPTLQRTLSAASSEPAANEFDAVPSAFAQRKKDAALSSIFSKLRHARAVLPGGGLRRTDYDGLVYEADGTALVPDSGSSTCGGGPPLD